MPFYNQLDPAFVPSVDTTSVGFGINTLANVSTGIHNTALGNNALNQLTTGNRNIAVGGTTLDSQTTGSDNTGIGHAAGTAVTTGSNNTCVGSTTAASLTTGSNNIYIGYNVDAGSSSESNAINIGGAIKVANVGSTNDVTLPGTLTVTGGVINSSAITRCGTQTDATTVTLANITGLSQAVVAGTYKFTIYLYGTCGGTGGWKVAFNYTNSAALSAINANALAFTASAVAASNTTTTTTQTSLIASNTAFTNAIITGTMVVSTGGTVALQFAENSANSTSSIFVGSTMQFDRIA